MKTTPATITIYSDPNEFGLSYAAHTKDGAGIDDFGGPVGPDLSHILEEDRDDFDFGPFVRAAVKAMEAADLDLWPLKVVELSPGVENEALAIIHVADRDAATRILEAL